jgi:chromosome partitioning protein
VGKTTLTLHLATDLALRYGKRVIITDADPQGNTTSILTQEYGEGMYNLLIAHMEPVRLVRGVPGWRIGLLPGGFTTGQAMTMLAAVGRLDEIPPRLRSLVVNSVDYLLIDMPPTQLPGFEQLLAAADWLLIPTKLERLSVEGVELMVKAAMEIPNGPGLLGIVPNLTRAHTKEHQAWADELLEVFKDAVWPPLPMTVRVPESQAYGTTVFDLCPDDPISQNLHAITDRVVAALED